VNPSIVCSNRILPHRISGHRLFPAVAGGSLRAGSVLMRALLACLVVGLAGCGTGMPPQDPVRIVDDAHSGGNALTISPDSRWGASGGWAGRIRLWSLPEGSPLSVWQTTHGDLSGLMFLPDSRRLLSTGRDGVVRVWDLNGRMLADFAVGSAVTSFYPGEGGGAVMLGHADGRVSRWTVDGRRLGLWELSDSRITAVAVDRSSTAFAAGDYRGRVWRWQTDGQPEPLQTPASHVRSLSFNPVDASLLGGGWFDLFRWPVNDVRLQVVPTDHRGIVNHLQFAADGRFVASISRQTDSAVLLLNPDTGETLSSFRKHALCGQRIVLSPDGRSMISNSDDASVRFYRLPALSSGETAAARDVSAGLRGR